MSTVPNLVKVPSVLSVARMEGEPCAISIGGQEKWVPRDGPRYSAVFEIDGPHVLVSREWAKAADVAYGTFCVISAMFGVGRLNPPTTDVTSPSASSRNCHFRNYARQKNCLKECSVQAGALLINHIAPRRRTLTPSA